MCSQAPLAHDEVIKELAEILLADELGFSCFHSAADWRLTLAEVRIRYVNTFQWSFSVNQLIWFWPSKINLHFTWILYFSKYHRDWEWEYKERWKGSYEFHLLCWVNKWPTLKVVKEFCIYDTTWKFLMGFKTIGIEMNRLQKKVWILITSRLKHAWKEDWIHPNLMNMIWYLIWWFSFRCQQDGFSSSFSEIASFILSCPSS